MNKTEKQHFIDACFADNLDDFYEKWVAEKKDRIQFFTVRDIDAWKKRITALSDAAKKMISKDVISFKHLPPVFNHHYWKPSSRCISSGEELTRENIDIHITYWQPHLWKPIRKDLKREYRKEEAYECQLQRLLLFRKRRK